MADSQRKTANLFDKDNTTIYNAYFDNTGNWLLSDDSKSIKFPCLPNTQYTLSVPNTLAVFRIYESSNPNLEPSISSRATQITRNSNIKEYTFTTSSTAQILLFQGSNGMVDEWFNGLMLNEGNTALPYEPYGWVHSLRKYGTETDTLTTLPAEVIADGNNATVGLVGNMVQSGTPSPSSIIMPSETGERTGNLFDYSTTEIGSISTTDGSDVEYDNARRSDFIPVQAGVTYTFSGLGGNIRIFEYKPDKTYRNTNYLYTIPVEISRTGYIRISGGLTAVIPEIMLNSGSTALPYEPYGYKIPILSGGTITPVYLGEVETTRRIKKLVLDGTEDWTQSADINNKYLYTDLYSGNNYVIQNENICSHFEAQRISINNNNQGFGVQERQSGSVTSLLIRYSGITDNVSTFKTYLQQQYQAGTPVTVWYVLATPTTGIVNEPLRKMGDYADTVSGISVPTLGTSEQFDVNTTLKPSEVQLTYTGWHPVTDVHEKSRNLFDELYPDVTTTIVYKAINVGNGSFTLSTNAPLVNNGALLFMLAGDVTTGASTSNNGVSESVSRTVTAVNGYITIAYIIRGGKSPADYEVMLNTGSTPLPYEPYWT